MTPLSFKQLQELTEYESVADVSACLTRAGIRFFEGKRGRPFTTTGLIEKAGFKHDQAMKDQDTPAKPTIEI